MSLNSKDLDNLISKLETLNKDIKKLPNKLSEEIAIEGFRELNRNYSLTPYDDNIQDVSTSVESSGNKASIIAQGRDVIYAEFGTGDKGEQNPHPDKSKYDLNAYNSGETIRYADDFSSFYGITSGNYWTYRRDGQFHITQGVPSGKQFFNTSKYLRDKGVREVEKRLVGDLLSKI